MKESLAWQKIVDGLGLDNDQQRLLKRFVLSSYRRQTVALWIYGPASSGKAALVRAITKMFSRGSVASICGCDLRRGRLALQSVYEHIARRGLRTLLIVRVTPKKAASSDLCLALVSNEPVEVDSKHKQVLNWRCDLPVLFVSDGPPPERIARRVARLELAELPKKPLPRTVSSEGTGRAVVRWALSA